MGGNTLSMRDQYDSRTSFASVAIVKRLPDAGITNALILGGDEGR